MFKRKIALASLCVGLFSSQAFSEGFFIGTEMGVLRSSGKNTYKVQETYKENGVDKTDTYIRNSKGSDVVFNPSIKLGYVINELNRVYGLYSYNTANSNNTFSMPFHKFALAYELTPQIYGNFRGVVGFNVGYAAGKYKGKKYTNTAEDQDDGSTHTTTVDFQNFSQLNNGFVYGAKIGALYEIDSNSEIEFGFKAEQARFKGKKQEEQIGFTDVNKDVIKVDPDNATNNGVFTVRNKPRFTNYGVYIGYNYKF